MDPTAPHLVRWVLDNCELGPTECTAIDDGYKLARFWSSAVDRAGASSLLAWVPTIRGLGNLFIPGIGAAGIQGGDCQRRRPEPFRDDPGDLEVFSPMPARHAPATVRQAFALWSAGFPAGRCTADMLGPELDAAAFIEDAAVQTLCLERLEADASPGRAGEAPFLPPGSAALPRRKSAARPIEQRRAEPGARVGRIVCIRSDFRAG